MITTTWKPPTLLKTHGITPHRLHEHIEEHYGGVSRTSVYRWSRAEPASIDLRILVKVIGALNDLIESEEPLKLTDIIDIDYQNHS